MTLPNECGVVAELAICLVKSYSYQMDAAMAAMYFNSSWAWWRMLEKLIDACSVFRPLYVLGVYKLPTKRKLKPIVMMLTPMKEKSMLRKWKKGLGLFLLAISPLVFTACLDDDNVPEMPAVAYVSFYHGSPETGALTITVDGDEGQKVYNTNSFEYTDYFNYGNFYPGERSFAFRPRNAANSLLDSTVNFVENQAYSFFMIDGEDALDVVIAEDDWDAPEVDHAMIRLVHLSPDAPAVSLQLNDEETNLFEGQDFMDVTEFEEITADKTSFVLKNADTGETILTANDLNIRDRRIYSLVVRGYANPEEGSSFDHDLSIQLVRQYPNY